ncbi:DUF1273 domain-containing protein [Caldalkalibacillus salinus]|uniref:DUF1273 domain-containing protein n=1 Tax=Caldalkalibacillus salinus TaxID=2803787 RepID=UPI0019215C7B|nr:DUF1273 domain-containing protein [Caldalkalibacillus salinus]
MVKSVVVTGYKAHELGVFNEKHPGIPYIKKAIEQPLRTLIEEGLEWVIISGQLGVELWAADVVFSLQEEYPHLQLAVLTPFLDQEKNWQEEKQERYQSILAQADYVNAISKRPYEGPWQFRAKNTFLLDHSDALILVYDDENEGTPKYLYEAACQRVESEDYTLIRVTSFDLQMIVDEETYEM